jgi:hypothetical protein
METGRKCSSYTQKIIYFLLHLLQINQAVDTMEKNPDDFLICPLFNFRIVKLLSKSDTTASRAEKIETSHKSYRLSDDVRLRLPYSEELTLLYDPLASELFGDYHKRIDPLTFFLEVSIDDHSEAEQRVTDAILAFRLHKSGDIFSDFMWSGCGDNATFERKNEPFYPEEYRISESELEEVKSLFDKICSLNLANDKRFRVPIDRFNRTYEERKTDDRIIDYAISLESLFFYGNKSPLVSAGQFVGVGCSMLLGKTREERDKINEFLVKAFEVRNKIVHGSEINFPIKILNSEYDLGALSKELQDYVRRSLRKLIQ